MKAKPEKSPPPKKRTLLVVDDEPSIRFLIKLIVERTGLELVGMAATGDAGLNYYRKYKPDLVLMDIDMPMKSGVAALRELIREFPRAKVSMLTSYADEEIVKECIGLGAVNYILKSAPIHEIQRIIESTLAEIEVH